MFRCALFAAAVCAILPTTRAADPDLSGHWVVYGVTPTGDSATCVLKVQSADGKPTAAVVSMPKAYADVTVSDFTAAGNEVSFGLKLVQAFGGQRIASDVKFRGTVGKDGKVVLGSLGVDTRPARAKMVATDSADLTPATTLVRTPAGTDYLKASQTANKPALAQAKLLREKDADKKAELRKELAAARDEAIVAVAMYRDLVAKHPDTVPAASAAAALIGSTDAKLTPDEAEKLVDMIRKQSDPYGPRFTGPHMLDVAESLARRTDVGTAAVKMIEPMVKDLPADAKAAEQVRVLSVYRTALVSAGKSNEVVAVDARLAKMETLLDREYLAAVPSFKPAPFAGRKTEGANQVAVFELFTGAQCPPCVAADVAFDALLKAYKPTDVVLLQYHVHIPGPDPLTNADTQERSRYYTATSAPSSFFNGTRAAPGGGAMGASERKFNQYVEVLNPLLEKKTDVTVTGKATRSGDKIDIAVTVDGADGDDVKLRLLVVEETVKYVGGNQVRFHHHVVRAMPGGAGGVAVKDKAFKHTATADVAAIRDGLTKYLDEYAATVRPFPKADRPMEMARLKVVALVQNDKTKEVMQAAQFDLGEK